MALQELRPSIAKEMSATKKKVTTPTATEMPIWTPLADRAAGQGGVTGHKDRGTEKVKKDRELLNNECSVYLLSYRNKLHIFLVAYFVKRK